MQGSELVPVVAIVVSAAIAWVTAKATTTQQATELAKNLADYKVETGERITALEVEIRVLRERKR